MTFTDLDAIEEIAQQTSYNVDERTHGAAS
jgi:hypothetical protein